MTDATATEALPQRRRFATLEEAEAQFSLLLQRLADVHTRLNRTIEVHNANIKTIDADQDALLRRLARLEARLAQADNTPPPDVDGVTPSPRDQRDFNENVALAIRTIQTDIAFLYQLIVGYFDETHPGLVTTFFDIDKTLGIADGRTANYDYPDTPPKAYQPTGSREKMPPSDGKGTTES